MTFLYILLAILVLMVMVTIHEFGHYVAGKLLGFEITEFSIGFGPSIFSRKLKSGEIFSIRIIPLGGYCAFDGEDTDSTNERSFLKQKPWKRLIVLFNGAFFNFISAILFCFILLVSVGYDVPQVYSVDKVVKINGVYEVLDGGAISSTEYEFEDEDKIIKINGNVITYQDKTYESISISQLSSVLSDDNYNLDEYTLTLKNGEAEKILISYVSSNSNTFGIENSLNKDDVILAVNGVNIDFIKDNTLNALISNASKTDNNLTLTVRRNGEKKDVVVNLFESGLKDDKGLYTKAIGLKSTAYVFNFGEALIRCVPYTFGFSWKVLSALGGIFTGAVGLNDIGGPIYTISTIANFSQQSISYFLTLLPLIAANLAVFNWLPIPALDGSKMVLTTIEWIRKKPLFSQKTENLIHNIGFFLLLGLVLLADLFHIFAPLFN